MFIKFNQLALLLCSVFILSCGYAEKETDKHPDLPLFPEHTNAKFKIKELPYKGYDLKGSYNGFLYTVCDSVIKKGYSGKQFLVLYNENLEQAKKVHIKGNLYIDKLGNVIAVRDSLREKYITQYNYPDFRANVIEKSPISLKNIHKTYREEMIRLREQDSTFDRDVFAELKYDEALSDFTGNNLTCYSEVSEYAIFKVNNKTYWQYREFDSNDAPSCYEFYELGVAYEKLLADNNLTKFDDAILGNKSSGNHVAFSYYQFGLEYFKLKIKNDTTSFKFNSRYLDGKSLICYKGFNDNQLILMSEWDLKLFAVLLNE